MASQISHILPYRKFYLTSLEKHFRNYGPDVKGIMRGYVHRVYLLNPALYNLFDLFYDKVNSRDASIYSPQKIREYQIFKAAKTQLLKYIKLKKENSEEGKLISSDIWTKAFTQAADQQTAQDLLQTSDEIQDILWLAKFASTFELSEEESRLDQEIDKTVSHLPEYFEKISIDAVLKETIESSLRKIQTFYLHKNYTETVKTVDELAKLLQPSL